jgi:hypothetical protein
MAGLGIGIGGGALFAYAGRSHGEMRVMTSGEGQPAGLAPHFPPRATQVIHLHIPGGPSQLEMLEFKPELVKYDGKPCPDSFFAGKQFLAVSAAGKPTLLGPQANFAQHGQCGAWVSDLLPHFAGVVDDVTFLKAVRSTQFNHAPAQIFTLTGNQISGRPTLGAWVNYALGSTNPNLPGYVVLQLSPGVLAKEAFSAGFMPSSVQGVQLRTNGNPVLDLANPDGISQDSRRQSIAEIEKLNAINYGAMGDPEILSRSRQYDLALRMQGEVPEAVDLAAEPAYIQALYGLDGPDTPASRTDKEFARSCLIARRLIERGVRYVQIIDNYHWDHHGGKTLSLREDLPNACRQIDQGMAALVTDLKQRGLLENTLVIWSGEFGRTPVQQGQSDPKYVGRDHHPYAYTMWMAGAGLKPGMSYGATDEFGFDPVSGEASVHDVHATILRLLGFDHEKLTYAFQGRDYRLTDVEGKVIDQILA